MIDWLKRAPVDPQIELNGAVVPITLRRHPSAKRLTLRLAPDGSAVRITLPQWARANEAIAFAHARNTWLAAQHARIPLREVPGDGATIQYRGEPVCIIWDESAARRPSRDAASLRIGGPRSGIEGRVKRWLEGEARSLFTEDMTYYTSAANLAPVPIALSRAQRRWGSCSDKQRIRINWRLVQAPDIIRRSVVAHEVAHLVHFDHSAAFHALLDAIFEGDLAQADSWLKTHGRTLYSAFG
ncbi:MAG: YgjP-like metallopeptidase domain-containing protein [Erythrobacter sp.]|jgi:predicted metal-dependent hydrolase|nr:YgjP-like metallopeptidase domain-containing protein [Erythrobacter sp.]